MSPKNTPNNRYFCIFDYFLDGAFLKWEEIAGECPILVVGGWDKQLKTCLLKKIASISLDSTDLTK